MRIQVVFNSTPILVPCGDGNLTVGELIQKAILRFKKVVDKVSGGTNGCVAFHSCVATRSCHAYVANSIQFSYTLHTVVQSRSSHCLLRRALSGYFACPHRNYTGLQNAGPLFSI